MNLYLLSQNENSGYDTYNACVVCAESEEDAKTITPSSQDFDEYLKEFYKDWAYSIEGVNCTLIGTAADNQERGVILASFNPG